MTVPTVERGLFDVDFWSMEIAGREAVDVVDVRLLHEPEELAGVGGERLDVAALALGVDRVERERRLPRAGEARDDHQLVARDADVDVLQVMFAGAADEDVVEGHGASPDAEVGPLSYRHHECTGSGGGAAVSIAACERTFYWFRMVGDTGFEPVTSAMSTQRSNQLS